MTSRHAINVWMRGIALTAATLVFALATTHAHAQATIGLYELARFDLSLTSNGSNAQFIGTNPVAVGWNGSKLYVAGFNGSASTGTTAMIEVTNAASVVTSVSGGGTPGFFNPTYSPTFGGTSTASQRGYVGLAMNGNQLAVAFDPGSNSPNGIQLIDALTNTRSWNLSATGTNTGNIGTARGMAGPDFNPGYLGNAAAGGGLGWVTQGVGRQLVNNTTTGSAIYVSATNATFMAANPTAAIGYVLSAETGTFGSSPTTWRDMAFDPATGDVYYRNQFGVTASKRTGANTGVNAVTNAANTSGYIYTNSLISGTVPASNNVGVNIGFMNDVQSSILGINPYSGNLLVFNDRGSTAAGQSWTDVIKFTTTSGSSISPTYTFLANPLTSTGAYDFEWDAATQTLAVVDYTNRNVSIFSTAVPEPSTWAMLVAAAGLGGGATLRRRMRRRG